MIRQLQADHAEAFWRLRRAALTEAPLAFGSSPEDDMFASLDRVREELASGPDMVVFGAFHDELVGAAGLFRDRQRKAAHKAHVWGMYVASDWRGRGVGASLLAALIDHARNLEGVTQVALSVSTAAPTAKRLYERAGFTTWGTERAAMRYNGQAVDEDHMVLVLG